MPEDFENRIIVKKDIGKLLRLQLAQRPFSLVDVIGIGGVTDAYQGAELKYRKTRTCLEVINEYKYPVHIATKSDLILNDADLLSDIANHSWCSVSFTVISLESSKSKFLDGRSPGPMKRLKAMSALKRYRSLQTGVLLMPLVPYLNDDPAELEELVKAAKDHGADYLLFAGGISMKNQQAIWFLKHLANRHPHLIPAYKRLFNFSYPSNTYDGNPSPIHQYVLKKNRILLELCDKHDLSCRMPRFVPSDYRRYNYLLAESLFNEHYLRSVDGKPANEIYWLAKNIQQLKLGITKENLKDVVYLNFPGREHLVPKLEAILKSLP